MSTLFDHWHVYPPFLMEEALLSISPARRGQLVKMLITLELHACQHCLTMACVSAFFDGRGFVEHQSSWTMSVIENAHNS